MTKCEGNDDDVRKFIEQVKEQDIKRAQTCHKLLAKITKDGMSAAA